MEQTIPVATGARPEALARALIDLLNARDLDGAEKHWHDDLIENFLVLRVYRGKRETRGFFEELFAAFPDFQIVVETVIGNDTTAFIAWRATGTFTGGAFQGVNANGARIEVQGVDRMEFSDGKLKQNTVYYDGAGFARAIGMLPPMESAAENAMKGAFNALNAVKRKLGVGG